MGNGIEQQQPQQVQPQYAPKEFPYLGIAALVAAGVVGYAAWKAGYLDNLFGGSDDDDYVTPSYDCNISGCDDGYECVPATGACKLIGTIPGTPRIISFAATNSPTKDSIEWEYEGGEIALLLTVAGSFTLIDKCPGCECKHRAGLRMYAQTADGTNHVIMQDTSGRAAGTWPISAGPGLEHVKKIRLEIFKSYPPGSYLCFGWSDNDIDIKSIQGTAMVIL